MAMMRGANGILTRALCVNGVDLGLTWSSNKGSMVHGELNTWPCPMLPVFEIRGVGMPGSSLGWPRHLGGLSHACLVA